VRSPHSGPRRPDVDPARYQESFIAEGRALADAAEGHLEARVPGCPDWNVADLLWHIGEVHYFWRTIAGKALRSYKDIPDITRPPDEDLVAWYRDGVEETLDAIYGADPTTEVWTWAPVKNVAWIQRRQAHETAVHRWDAQSATGNERPIAPDIAVDGVDEFFEFMLPLAGDGLTDGGELVHLHATDAAGEWLVTVDGGTVAVAREHGKGDAAVRGTASDLVLLLWRRVDPSALEVLGDVGALERFLARAGLD
jgi:uncharacterized protein (TIGR03083 family)